MFKNYQKISGGTFKKVFFSVLMLFISESFVYAGSKVIIIGKSSIIIESSNNITKLIASKIETVSGGKLIKEIGQDVASEKSVDVSDGFDNGLPTEFVIEKAYPNPFNPTTRIRYGVSTPSAVNVAIYDMTGRLVSDYEIGEKAPGWHEFTWQGTDKHGQQVSTGMYFVTMRAGEHFQKQKVTFLK
jgi:hypothetical protein